MLTLGTGGNSSIKSGGVTWVKASGTWLSQALTRLIMVSVRKAPQVAALKADPALAGRPMVRIVTDANPTDLRRSLEAAVHCVRPQRVVTYFHRVEALAALVLAERDAHIAARLMPGTDVLFMPIMA